MQKKLFQKIIESVPSAVVVLDKRYRVECVNGAFLRCFGAEEGKKKSLKESISCREKDIRCGEGKACFSCLFKRMFDRALAQESPVTDEIPVKLPFGNASREVSVRMHVKALDKRHAIGIIDGVYEQEIVKELQTAQHIQQRLLPEGKEAGGVRFRYMFIPCRDIGGDLPDVYEVNGRETFGVIADVSGKGISAGMLSAFVKAGFDKNEPSPAKAIQKLNDKFSELNLDETSYITVAAVRINSEEKRVEYSMAGHNAPILLKRKFGVDEIMQPAPPVSTWMANFAYQDYQTYYEKGDILVLLTDGVTESRNEQGEMFGIERVESILLTSPSSDAFIERLRANLKEFCGNFDDDITAIAFDL